MTKHRMDLLCRKDTGRFRSSFHQHRQITTTGHGIDCKELFFIPNPQQTVCHDSFDLPLTFTFNNRSKLTHSSHRSSSIYHVSVMPCFDKKLEASRMDFFDSVSQTRDVDSVITSIEIIQMINDLGIDFLSLPESPIEPLCVSTLSQEDEEMKKRTETILLKKLHQYRSRRKILWHDRRVRGILRFCAEMGDESALWRWRHRDQEQNTKKQRLYRVLDRGLSFRSRDQEMKRSRDEEMKR